MRMPIALVTTTVGILGALGVPTRPDSHTNKCIQPTVRRSWTRLSAAEKQAYINGVLCLMNAPSKTAIPGAVTRYDDLVGAHQIPSDIPGGTDTWHLVGQFLHIHRYFLHAHEILLRNECGYTGPIVYWHEPADAGAFHQSPVVADFGGSGGLDGKISDGPFGNLIVNLGPGGTPNNTVHKITRRINETWSAQTAQSFVDATNAITTFGEYKTTFYRTIHVGGHLGLGGEMRDFQTSPNDPLFFLHHAYLDAVWARWQNVNTSRLTDLAGAGYETQAEPATGYVETNPATVLFLDNIIPNVTVADVADIQGGYLCYEYEDA